MTDLAPVSGGFWSSAFVYRAGADELVFRLSDMPEGFLIDTAAMRFASRDLPIPEVVETGALALGRGVRSGQALGAHFAISRRHHGQFVETSPVQHATAVGDALETLLAALRAVDTGPEEPVLWAEPDAPADMTWHTWLRSGLVDDPAGHVSGWRATLAADPRLDSLFRACESRIEELLPACPERRDLVHGDLLHQNVMVSDDYTRVTAIFSWKCSVRGDFLFDVAWCTFWGPWHPAIAAADMWQRTLAAADLSEADLVDARCATTVTSSRSRHPISAGKPGRVTRRNSRPWQVAAERTLARGPLPA